MARLSSGVSLCAARGGVGWFGWHRVCPLFRACNCMYVLLLACSSQTRHAHPYPNHQHPRGHRTAHDAHSTPRSRLAPATGTRFSPHAFSRTFTNLSLSRHTQSKLLSQRRKRSTGRSTLHHGKSDTHAPLYTRPRTHANSDSLFFSTVAAATHTLSARA